MKKLLILFIVIKLVTSCNTPFQFGKYRSDKGYEYEFFADSTISFNGQVDGYSSCSEGKVEIHNNNIIGKIAYCNDMKETRVAYDQTTNLGMSRDSISIRITFHFLDDSTICKGNNKEEYSVTVLDKEVQRLGFSNWQSDSIVELKLPKSFNMLRVRLNVNHCYSFYHDITIYGCYNYSIDFFYNLGYSNYKIHGIDNINFKRRENYIFTILDYGLFKRKITKYYYVEDEK